MFVTFLQITIAMVKIDVFHRIEALVSLELKDMILKVDIQLIAAENRHRIQRTERVFYMLRRKIQRDSVAVKFQFHGLCQNLFLLI